MKRKLFTDLQAAVLKLKANPILIKDILYPKARLTRLLELLQISRENSLTIAEKQILMALLNFAVKNHDVLLANALQAEIASRQNLPLPHGTNLTEWGLLDG